MAEVQLGTGKELQAGTAEGRYSTLESLRMPFLGQARASAKLTIPSLMPDNRMAGGGKLYQPFQSVGARGVNNLASKLLLTLLPPNAPFFRLSIDDYVLENMKGAGGPAVVTEVQRALARYERAVMTDIEGRTDRVSLFEANKQLVVAGNVLLFDDPDVGLRVFTLDTYVVQRDSSGNVLEIVVKESLALSTLPEEARKLVVNDPKGSTGGADIEKSIDLYTWIRRTPRNWVIEQQIGCHTVPGSEGTYPLDALPWYPLRMVRIAGEHYGRGYVEEFYGDLKSLEGLSKSVVEGTAAAAKVLFLVNPNGVTRQKTLAESPNGSIKEGNAADVTVVQMEKYNDFRVALETMNRIEQRVGQAFLLNSAVTRDAERVTAEEIRLQAQELEDSLGGLYSLLTQEFQLPYIRVKMRALSRRKDWPKLPKGMVKPKIVTGLEGLGRGHDRNRLLQFASTIANTFGPEAMARYIDASEFIKRLGVSDGIDTDGLVKTAEQVTQEMAQEQMTGLAQNVAPEVVRGISAQAQAAQQ